MRNYANSCLSGTGETIIGASVISKKYKWGSSQLELVNFGKNAARWSPFIREISATVESSSKVSCENQAVCQASTSQSLRQTALCRLPKRLDWRATFHAGFAYTTYWTPIFCFKRYSLCSKMTNIKNNAWYCLPRTHQGSCCYVFTQFPVCLTFVLLTFIRRTVSWWGLELLHQSGSGTDRFGKARRPSKTQRDLQNSTSSTSICVEKIVLFTGFKPPI